MGIASENRPFDKSKDYYESPQGKTDREPKPPQCKCGHSRRDHEIEPPYYCQMICADGDGCECEGYTIVQPEGAQGAALPSEKPRPTHYHRHPDETYSGCDCLAASEKPSIDVAKEAREKDWVAFVNDAQKFYDEYDGDMDFELKRDVVEFAARFAAYMTGERSSGQS